MIIDLNQKLTFCGEDIPPPTGKGTFTLADACRTALNSRMKQDAKEGDNESIYKNGCLSEQIWDHQPKDDDDTGSPTELTDADLTMLRGRIGEIYPAPVVVPCFRIIDTAISEAKKSPAKKKAAK